MESKFKLKGLSRSKSMTCETSNGELFWPKVNLTQDRFDALWGYCKGEWSEKKVVVIEHDGIHKDGTPKNASVIGVELE